MVANADFLTFKLLFVCQSIILELVIKVVERFQCVVIKVVERFQCVVISKATSAAIYYYYYYYYI